MAVEKIFASAFPRPAVKSGSTVTIILVTLVLAILGGCSSPQNQTFEITGTTAERVAKLSRLIESNTELPSKILDARLIELKFGDGQLGPSDFRSFIWIKVMAEDAAKWKAVLQTPPNESPAYDAPPTEPKWWISSNAFDKLIKYDSHSIFDRSGWILVKEDGNVFALTYTQ